MKRDPLFFRFFKELPSSFFRLIGRPASDASRYDLDAIEYKETSVRLDGVFQPREPDKDPAYIWEAQYYSSDRVYANLMTKIGRFLEHGSPNQDWAAVVIYPNRSMEQKNLLPYRCLLNSDQLIRVYLDELPPSPPDQFEMGILEMIAASPNAAMEKAQEMVPRVRASKVSPQFQRLVIQFIETVIVYQFPQKSRAEVERMLQVSDVRQTRVFQEAHAEGMEKGMEKGKEEIAVHLMELGQSIELIKQATGFSEAKLRKLKKRLANG